jgi:hypothetical protein
MTVGLRLKLKRKYPVLWNRLRVARLLARTMKRAFGFHPRVCSVCGYQGKFLSEIHFPDIFNFDAVCPSCGSLPRNRLLALAIRRGKVELSDKRMLHFAPEDPIVALVSRRCLEYTTADLFRDDVDIKQDIERMTLGDGTYDLILCSHVLEHVDHNRALREIYRVLSPGGVALLLFPVVEGWRTHFQDPAITSPSDRALFYGKDNHLRRFGSSVRDEVIAAGFRLDEFSPSDSSVVENALLPGEVLFIARKD